MATKSRSTKAAAAPKKTAGHKPKDTGVEKQAATPKAPSTATPPQPRDDSGEICVFALRLTRAERNEIHSAAGPASASRFVKRLALAAARGDMKAVTEIVDGVKR